MLATKQKQEYIYSELGEIYLCSERGTYIYIAREGECNCFSLLLNYLLFLAFLTLHHRQKYNVFNLKIGAFF